MSPMSTDPQAPNRPLHHDLAEARRFLDAAAESYRDGHDIAQVQAAAMIGFGYSQLAYWERSAEWRAEDLVRDEARRAEDLELVDRRFTEQRHYEERVAAAQEAPVRTVEDHMAAIKAQLGYERERGGRSD